MLILAFDVDVHVVVEFDVVVNGVDGWLHVNINVDLRNCC